MPMKFNYNSLILFSMFPFVFLSLFQALTFIMHFRTFPRPISGA